MKKQDKIFITNYDSPVGRLILASDAEALVGLWIEGQKYEQASLKKEPVRKDGLKIWDQTGRWLDRYFSGEKPLPAQLPLNPGGTPFQQLIWGLLCQIPYGKTTTYGELARTAAFQMGRDSMSPQAVGGAVGHNPISIIIPCHRVVGADGSLTGYAGGLEKKLWLLQLEGACPDRLED